MQVSASINTIMTSNKAQLCLLPSAAFHKAPLNFIFMFLWIIIWRFYDLIKHILTFLPTCSSCVIRKLEASHTVVTVNPEKVHGALFFTLSIKLWWSDDSPPEGKRKNCHVKKWALTLHCFFDFFLASKEVQTYSLGICIHQIIAHVHDLHSV